MPQIILVLPFILTLKNTPEIEDDDENLDEDEEILLN
jgi:hypothetical protein